MEKKCENKATHKFTWPGRDESYICREHLPKLQGTARTIGLYLQVIPLNEDEKHICNQMVKASD